MLTEESRIELLDQWFSKYERWTDEIERFSRRLMDDFYWMVKKPELEMNNDKELTKAVKDIHDTAQKINLSTNPLFDMIRKTEKQFKQKAASLRDI